ncbi:hypothetical protein RJ641_013596 [Dillenia turbinata]|uniref:Uncharacterized protein n=1 Tax=Dillenia turbinata TaxID=194707 RepID=A0AAN8ZQP3_9MAGN
MRAPYLQHFDIWNASSGFPTDAVFLTDGLKTGIRLCRGDAEGRIIPRDEVENCLSEATSSGEKAKKMKENAIRWRKAAEAAVAEGGSSNWDLQELTKVDSIDSIYAVAAPYPIFFYTGQLIR